MPERGDGLSSDGYRLRLARAMELLAADERVVFLGQGVRDPGTFMSQTLLGVPLEKRIELPVMEEAQMGMSIGLALAGAVPVTLYPRWNFLVLAANQLVNHVNVMRPRVIVRVGVGSRKPLDPGPQHVGDFTSAFRSMMPNTMIVALEHTHQIVPAYAAALDRRGPTVLVEYMERYDA